MRQNGLGGSTFLEIGDIVTVVWEDASTPDCKIVGVPSEGNELFAVEWEEDLGEVGRRTIHWFINPHSAAFCCFRKEGEWKPNQNAGIVAQRA